MTAAGQDDPLLGQLVDGRYRVDELLGEGGMGRVYLAEEPSLQRHVALKVLAFPDADASGERRSRFEREARAASKINHPNSVTIYGYGAWEGELYLAMEFLDGLTLRDLIDRDGFVEQTHAARLIAQTCAPLQAAHEAGILHRDLKPDNIMIVRGPEGGEQVKVVDFGLALLYGESEERLTRDGIIVGTPHYMSPEQGRGIALTPHSDIYGLGVVLYELLCGEVPFKGASPTDVVIQHLYEEPKPPSEQNPLVTLHPALESLALWAMAKEQTARPQSAHLFADELRAALNLIDRGQTVAPDRARKAPLSEGGRATRATELGLGTPSAVPLPPLGPAARAARILVIEASGDFAGSITARLRARGLGVDAAQDLAAVTAASDVELVVLDLGDGAAAEVDQAAAWLARDGAGTPLIAVGPDDAMATVTRCLEAGFADYVPRSLAGDRLERVVKRVMKRARRAGQRPK